MNARYRKQMRLKSRHARRGHTARCVCPEEVERLRLFICRRFGRWKDTP